MTLFCFAVVPKKMLMLGWFASLYFILLCFVLGGFICCSSRVVLIFLFSCLLGVFSASFRVLGVFLVVSLFSFVSFLVGSLSAPLRGSVPLTWVVCGARNTFSKQPPKFALYYIVIYDMFVQIIYQTEYFYLCIVSSKAQKIFGL